MQIAFISYWSCPRARLGVLTAGGMNVYTLNLGYELGKRGHRVDIFTREHRGQKKGIINLKRNVRLIHLKATGDDHFRKGRQFGRNLIGFIKNDSGKYDIFHAHYYYSALSGIEVVKHVKAPLAVTFHTLGEMKKIYAGIIDKPRIETERGIVGKADALIASTELEKDELIRYYQANPEKIHVVIPGVDHRLFRPKNKAFSRRKLNLPKNKKIILFVGRIDPVKGINLLIEAVGGMQAQVLLIGGDIESRRFWQNREVKRIKENIESNKLNSYVKFLGSKAHRLLPWFYSAADLVVLPSVYESFGFVILEAMACAAPVIVSRSGGLKYLIEDGKTGVFFESGNPADLAGKLKKLLRSEKQAVQMGIRAYGESQKYCWDKQAVKMVEVYRKISG